MIQSLRDIDAAFVQTRSGWGWLGQLAVIVLGVHLAADRLDDLLFDGIMYMSLPWPDPGTPAYLASWSAVWLELAVIAWAFMTLVSAKAVPAVDWADWKTNASLMSIVRPMFWLPVGLAGAWVVGMSAEDLIAPYHLEGGRVAAYVVSGLIAWRLTLTGSWTVASAARTHTTRVDGWWWAPVPLVIAGLAITYGLPVWGLLS